MENSKNIKADSGKEVKLQLREEQLDISKKQIQTGDVKMHIEVLTEETTVTVPVTREVLVIEKEVLGDETPGGYSETIRIPVKEERLEIVKHPVVLEDVNIYKRQFQKTQSIEGIVKKEKAYIETVGSAEVIDKGVERD